MVWIFVAILVVVIAILVVRNRNLRARLPIKAKPLALQTAPFFQLQCEFGETDIKQGRGIVAMVMSPLGDAVDIVPESATAGEAYAALVRIASPEGGFTSTAVAYGDDPKCLRQGDIVICVPVAFREHLAEQLNDPRLGWLWELGAQIDPFADPTKGFKVIRRFEPPKLSDPQ